MVFIWRIVRKLRNLRRGREILFFLNTQLGFSKKISRRLTKFIKVCIYPGEYLKRRRLAQTFVSLDPPNSPPIRVDLTTGYVITNVGKLSWGAEAVEASRTIYQSRKNDLVDSAVTSGKSHFRPNLLTRADLLDNPVFLRFATSPSIIEPISKYLGTIPVIGDIYLWISKTNYLTESSQLFHIDQEDFRQVKVFVLISDVSTENGPLTFVPARQSSIIYRRANNPFKRIPDELVNEICQKNQQVEIVGQAGTVGMVDTCRCYHMGSRTRSGIRLVLTLHYLPFNCIMEANPQSLHGIRHNDLQGSDWPDYCPELLLRSKQQELVWKKTGT